MLVLFSRAEPELTSQQKYGRPNEATPAKWQAEYKDYNAPIEGTIIQPVKEKTAKYDVLAAPPVAPNGEADDHKSRVDSDEVKSTIHDQNVKTESNGAPKKRKHEGETSEERAERKRKKKEKKEKKERKQKEKAAKTEVAGEDSD